MALANSAEIADLPGESYFTTLAHLHATLNPSTYFEIGTQTGASLLHAKCDSIAVDPAFRIGPECIARLMDKPSLHLYQLTSDQFFEKHDPIAIFGKEIDLAFLDGMHLCDYLLKDFINTERYCSRNGTIVLHDCLPVEEGIADRDGPQPNRTSVHRQGWWAGDVWRTALLIKRKRSDLRVRVYDAHPTGLVIVDNLDPDNVVLSRNYDSFLDEMLSWPYQSLGIEGLKTEFGVQATRTLYTRLSVNLGLAPKTSLVDNGGVWKKPAPMIIASQIIESIPTSIYANESFGIKHPLSIDIFDDAFIYGRSLIVDVGPPSLIFTRDSDLLASTTILDHIASEPFADVDVATGLSKDNRGYFVEQKPLEQAERIYEKVLLLTPDEYPNYGMWLINAIPAAYLFRTTGMFSAMMAPVCVPWQKRLISDIIGDAHFIQQELALVYHVDQIGMLRCPHHYLKLSEFELEAFDAFAATSVIEGTRASYVDKIFVSRLLKTAEGGHRALSNEAELVSAMEARGFYILQPEHFSIKEQASIFANAKIVVGLGGAGMFNTVFCKADTIIISIESNLDFVMQHSNLFGSRSATYGFLIGEVDAEDVSPHQKRWKLDVPWAMSLLDKQLS